jgi:hypothetical protein
VRVQILSSLAQVGHGHKAIGYLPMGTIEHLGLTIAEVASDAASRGLEVVHLTADQCCIRGGAVYVYDRIALTSLLASGAGTLIEHKWPTDPDQFVLMTAQIWLPLTHPVTKVINAAFRQ